MFRGFQLQEAISDTSHLGTGQRIHDRLSRAVTPVLEKYVLSSGILDGSRIQEDWFPSFPADIFISHSHANAQVATALAGWLYDSFGLTAFVDSCIWGNADDLQREIDNKFCRNPSGHNYNYQERNYATSHVHMMLNTALSKMMDRCECLFFLKTPESTIKSIIKDKEKTSSPWIYSEISMSRFLRKRIPERMSKTAMIKAFSAGGLLTEQQREKLQVEYELELGHLMPLTSAELARWEHRGNQLHRDKSEHVLDILYRLKPITKR